MHSRILTWLKAFLLLNTLYLVSFEVHAANELRTTNLPDQLINKARHNTLWDKQVWLNLLHYQGSTGHYLSQVDDKVFFTATDGKTNPEQELLSTLQAFYSEDLSDPDNHAQCRFIARLNWLRTQLPDTLVNLPSVNCGEYTEWRKQVPGHKVSLIFPAYHLNSPSSMFGHTLLRIDPADEVEHSTWLSMAVNFGANIQSNDNSLLFAVKGLAGGYSGTFIVTPYYNKIKEYNREENRDIWEYPLNLTPQETENMVQHLWELKNINFDYYFFDENCSYRLLELLEVARPSIKLTDQFGLTAIPVDTVRSIDQANLITDISYRPSMATNINYLLKQLSNSEQDLVLKLSRDASLVTSHAFKQSPQSNQNIMMDAAYRYLRYQQNDVGRSESNAKNSYRLLQAINATDDFKSVNAGFTEQQKPEKGHLSKRFDMSIGNNNVRLNSTNEENDRSYAQLQFRMSFHSLEDNLSGFLEGAQINIGSLTVRAYEDEAQLQQLDLIDIFSLSPRNQFFQPLSWRVYTGLEQQLINGEDHLTGHVSGGAGVAYEPWSQGYFYAMATARLEANSQFSRNIEPALGISSGLLHHSAIGTTHLELSGEEFLNHEYRHRIEFTQNIPLGRNHAVKFLATYQHQESHDFTDAHLSYHYFFH